MAVAVAAALLDPTVLARAVVDRRRAPMAGAAVARLMVVLLEPMLTVLVVQLLTALSAVHLQPALREAMVRTVRAGAEVILIK